MNRLFYGPQKSYKYTKSIIARRIVCILTLLLIFIHSALAADKVKRPEIDAGAAILMDADTKQILYSKNIHTKEYPASLTKILTAVLALEKGKLSDTITMSKEAIYDVPVGASNIALQPGEKLTLEQALYATLLMSSNDAANGIAEYIGGSLEGFADIMNERTRELGALNSSFVNSNGLSDDNQYTTAYDLALITLKAISIPDFNRIDGTITYVMDPTNLQPLPRGFANEQRMMKNTPYYYEGVFAGKTGYTEKAGHTLATAARIDGRTLICIVLDCQKSQTPYEDTKTLLDYGFDDLNKFTMTRDEINGKLSSLPAGSASKAIVDSDFTALVPEGFKSSDISIELDEADAAVSFSLDASDMGEASVLGSLKLSYPAAPVGEITKVSTKPNGIPPLLPIAFGAVAAFLLIAALFISIKRKQRRLRRKRNRKRPR